MEPTRRAAGGWPALFLAAGLCLPAVLFAQRPVDRAQARPDFSDSPTASGTIEGTEPGGLFPPDDTQLIEELKSILLLPREGTGTEEPLQPGTVEDHGAGVPPEVLETMERYLGHPVSLDILNEMVRTVVLAYRKHDRPVVDVYVPEQEITAGVVRLQVVEGVLGEVRVEGATHSNPDYLRKNIRLEPGEAIRSSSLNRDLDWLNRNPLRAAGLIFEPGEEEGTSDVLVSVQDAKPFHVFGSVGNTGLAATGEYELSAGFLYGHFLGTEGFLTYSATSDLDFENLLAHSLYAKAPLPWRHEVEAFVSHVETDTAFQLGGVTIGSGGRTTQAGLGYVVPLPPVSPGALHELTVGLDYKRTNSDLEFGGISVFDEVATVFQLRGEYGVTFSDPLGQTSLDLAAIFSPGNVLAHNDEASFAALNPGALPHYWYFRGGLERIVNLPKGSRLLLETRGQWSDDRLLPSEQHLIGGVGSVRGYDEFLLRGDRGIVARAQWEAPRFEAPILPGDAPVPSLTPFVFYDLGMAETADPFAGESAERLRSAGLGTRIELGKQLRLEGSYGWGLEHPDDLLEPETGRFHFMVRSRF